jgi:lipoprotein-anchoring transpeptidase ErfK/SrfK
MNRRLLIKSISFIATVGSTSLQLMALSAGAKQVKINENETLEVDPRFRKTQISFQTQEAAGTIIVDPHSKYLYFVIGEEQAIRYGIGVGRRGFEWTGEAVIRHKAKWPRWTPPKRMIKRDEFAAKWANGMPGGLTNPLGARALYLFQGDVDTLYRIHGTNQPQSIGTATSSGCIRMINVDAIDLYERVKIGAKVVVVSTPILEPLAETPKSTAPILEKIFNRGIY